MRKNQFDRALPDLNESIRLDPNSACALTNRGRVHGFKGDLDRAIVDYDEAIRLDPTFALAYNNRGAAYRSSSALCDDPPCSTDLRRASCAQFACR